MNLTNEYNSGTIPKFTRLTAVNMPANQIRALDRYHIIISAVGHTRLAIQCKAYFITDFSRHFFSLVVSKGLS